MIKATGIYHMGIPCNDVGRAVKFYTEILGITVAKLNRDDMGKGLNRADLRCGTGMVVLFSGRNPWRATIWSVKARRIRPSA
jgi:catechol 2,3-dioxygenase-like lactoylglutathione lyase family enzyme